MRKCNFLHGLPLVNLQAATLINTIQANVSQHCHANINHSDVSFLTSVLPLARSQAPRGMGREGERRREGGRKNKGGGTMEGKDGDVSAAETEGCILAKRLID